MRTATAPSLPGLIERLGPIPEDTPVTTLLIANTGSATLADSAQEAIVRHISADLAARPTISRIRAHHLDKMSEILPTKGIEFSARNRATLRGIAESVRAARRSEAAAQRTAKLLAPDKDLAHSLFNEQRDLSRPARRAIALACSLAVGSTVGGAFYYAEKQPYKLAVGPRLEETRTVPGQADYPVIAGLTIFGLGAGLVLGGFAGEGLKGPAARLRARQFVRGGGQSQTTREEVKSPSQPVPRYYPPAHSNLKPSPTARTVRAHVKQPRPHNAHGSAGNTSRLGRGRGGSRRGKR